jgi:hypothetical protein
MSPAVMKKAEAAARSALSYIDALNFRDYPLMKRLLSPECRFETPFPPPRGTVVRKRESIISYWEDLLRRSPRLKVLPTGVRGFGSRCVLYWMLDPGDGRSPEEMAAGTDHIEVLGERIISIASFMKGSEGDWG